MFEITIKGDTMSELAANIALLKTQFQTTAPEGGDAAKPARKAKAVEPVAEEPEAEELTDEDALDAPAKPMPEGADAIVDAGTGQPIPKAKAKAKEDEPIQMTMDDVKVAAAKLVAKDQASLVKILQKYKAANLSAVPKDKLGDFAADVMEALEAE